MLRKELGFPRLVFLSCLLEFQVFFQIINYALHILTMDRDDVLVRDSFFMHSNHQPIICAGTLSIKREVMSDLCMSYHCLHTLCTILLLA